MLTLLASAARTADGNSGALGKPPHPEQIKHARFILDVIAAATDAGDTLDVYIQKLYDGTNWDDFVHFTQVLGNGGAKEYIAEWHRDDAVDDEEHVPQDAALAAGIMQGGHLGTDLRVKWAIVDSGDADQSFTFSVGGEFTYDK